MFETVGKSYFHKLVLRSAVVVILGGFFTAVILYLFLDRKPGSSYGESYRIISALRQELLYKSTLIYVGTSIFILVGIVVIALLYSHRVAGPLFRLETFARKIATGDLSETVKLRKHDVIHPLADDMNKAVSFYKDTVIELEVKIKEIKDIASGLDNPEDLTDHKKLQAATDALSRKTDEINRLLSVIKL